MLRKVTMRQSMQERVVVPVQIKKAEVALPIEPERIWDEEFRRKNKPWYLEILESQRCALFFLDNSHLWRHRAKLNDLINRWLDVREVHNALQMKELTLFDIDELEIPMLPLDLVVKIKEAYKKKKKR